MPRTRKQFDVVVVGGGHGGAQTAIALRQRSFGGTIAIISEEKDLPYERPPLSKEYLSGDKDFERMLIRPAAFWVEREVRLSNGKRVVAVEPNLHEITLDNGAAVRYGSLVWAAGGKPRKLSCTGHHLSGVHSVRSRTDVDRMKIELAGVRRVVVIGGGYIGLEAAAVLTKAGKAVTVLEAQDRVLARVAGEALSRFYEKEHRAHGVDVRTNVTVDCLIELDGRVAGARLTTGEFISADMAIVGIGIEPAVEPLRAAGAAGTNGVSVDAQCRTTLADVFAIGDCAAHVNPFAGGATIRLESVQNACDQALIVAKALTGVEEAYCSIPWFWSTQYDLRLQTVGLSTGYDSVAVRGDPASRSFSVIYFLCGRVLALDCVNATRDFVQGRALVASRFTVDPMLLSDPRRDLKTFTAGQSGR